MTIEAAIFDYGGVISTPLLVGVDEVERRQGWPPGSVARLVFGDETYATGGGTDPDRPPTADGEGSPYVTHDWHRLEVGELSLAEWFATLHRRAPEVLGEPLDAARVLSILAELPFGVHWPIVHAARDLRDRGLRLGLLTNNVREWGDRWRSTFPVEELFGVVVDSSEVGVRKPDPRIYLLTCERLGCRPEAAVFLDDNAENCDAAEALGMEVIRVTADPFVAVRELDAVLTRRGTAGVGRGLSDR